MKKLNAMEMRTVEGGATYYSKEKMCPKCGTRIKGKASGIALLAACWKYKAEKDCLSKYNAHINKCWG